MTTPRVGPTSPDGPPPAPSITRLLEDPRGHGTREQCPIETAVRALDGKWTMLIVRELLPGPRRFGELADALPHVSPKTLVERLRYLEGTGVLLRTAYPERPRRVDYRLTAVGEQLVGVLRELWDWGARLQDHRQQGRGTAGGAPVADRRG